MIRAVLDWLWRRSRLSTATLALLVALTLASIPSHAAPPEPTKYSAAALYNLGNSYARAGKPGMAVLNYERARLLAPDDPDIRANLQHVRATAGLAPEMPTAFDRVARLANPLLLSWAGLAGLLLAALSVLAWKTYPPRRRVLGAAAFFGLALCSVTVCSAIAMWPSLHRAVVVTPSAPVRVAPVPMGEPLFTLREAEVVTASAHHDTFVLIQNRAGRRGWVSSENIARLLPTAEN